MVQNSPTCGRPGAQLDSTGSCRWSVWAPTARSVDLVLWNGTQESNRHAMLPEAGGWFALNLADIRHGQRYTFSLDGGPERPDPASRWQPDGVHRSSAVFRPEDFAWTDACWRGVSREDLVIYELHVGTFTPEGTFDAVLPRLPELVELGVTAIELMPVAQFPGHRNWGYDGVHWFAVQNSYGGPRALQRLVDAAHAAGLAVILDVVYNHLGPEGNYLAEFGPYFTEKYHTPWGAALNYDDAGSDEVREFVLANVEYWLVDFHLDGLRLDAIHAICDTSQRHLLTEIGEVARDVAAQQGRAVQIIAESNLNDVRLLQPISARGFGLDAQWNDDFHHCVHTLLTGEEQGYYADFPDPPRQLVKALNRTFVYDGCYSEFLQRRHGASDEGLPGDRFVISIQTHDQVGNRARGERLHELVSPAAQRLAAGLLLLAPGLPMLWMGEEYGETRRFPFFCDFGDPGLQEAVRNGRRQEFAAFGWAAEVPDPQDAKTFEMAQLSWNWSDPERAALRRLYADLLRLRRTVPALRDFNRRSAWLAGAKLELLVLQRGDVQTGSDCLCIFNLTAEPAAWPTRLVAGRPLLFDSASDVAAERDVLNGFQYGVWGGAAASHR